MNDHAPVFPRDACRSTYVLLEALAGLVDRLSVRIRPSFSPGVHRCEDVMQESLDCESMMSNGDDGCLAEEG